MSMKADPATASSSGTVASRRLPRRIHWLVTAAIAAISSGIAVVQDPRPDPFTSPALLTADWLKHPRERNAFKRVHALTATLNSVYAIRGTGRVWAVGNGGLLIHSEDGGRTWRQDSIVAPQTHSREQEPSGSADVSQNAGPMVQGEVDTDTSYAGRPPLNTQSKAQNPPGGKGFSPRDSTPKGDDPGPLQASSARLTDNFHDVYFASPLRGWVAGGQGLIAQTMDGGGTWTVGRIAGANDIVAGWFGPDSVWFVVDRDGTPFWTGDSGEWAGSRADGPSTVRSFSAVSAKFGYVVTSEGAVQPSKVGVDISFRGSRQGPFREISFIDSLRGWATDSNGGLWTTTDAGGRWDSLPGQSTSLRGRINFSDAQTGWAVSERGHLLRTGDGGREWTHVLGRLRLHAAALAGRDDGWAVGGAGGAPAAGNPVGPGGRLDEEAAGARSRGSMDPGRPGGGTTDRSAGPGPAQ